MQESTPTGPVGDRPSAEGGGVPRGLTSLGEAVDQALEQPAPGGCLSFGLASLDEATGGLRPGRLTLVAAAPGAGGSLLALAAARHCALTANKPVLYAASGLTVQDVTRRILAAESGADYRRLRDGTLTTEEHAAVERVHTAVRHAPLHVDAGSGLSAEAIAETAPFVDHLALIVIDRLQQIPAAHVPLSGDRLPAAARTLAHLARTLHVPVLAVIDAADAAAVQLLDADVTLTLTLDQDTGTAEVVCAERDLGPLSSARLHAELAHARFTDAPRPPVAGPAGGPSHATAPVTDETARVAVAERALIDAALPYTSHAQAGLPANVLHILAALRDAVLGAEPAALPGLRAQAAALAATAPAELSSTVPGARLQTALTAFAQAHAATPPAATAHPADGTPGQAEDTAPPLETGAAGESADGAPAPPQPTPADEDAEASSAEGGNELEPGDEEQPVETGFPALDKLKESVGRSKMHPIQAVRKDERADKPWSLFHQAMDGEPGGWVHPDVTREKIHDGRGGRRYRLLVPDSFGPGRPVTIDRNGSFPSACSAVPLAPNKLLHTGPLEFLERGSAGACLIDIPAWNHPLMPHPLGRLVQRADDQGRVWAVTPHIRLLQRLMGDEKLRGENIVSGTLVIHDSWTGKSNESLFKPFYADAKKARDELITAGEDQQEAYVDYKRRVSKALRLLWPKGDQVRSPFWRPDWYLSMVAEASVRHWVTAFKAVQQGHTLIALRNVDEAVFHTPDGTVPAPYRVGTSFGEVKVKHGAED